MQPSDLPEREDALLGEVARQLAEAAPPPPGWDRIDTATRFPIRHTRTWPQFAAVAAAVATLVVGGLLLLTRPDERDEIPAEPPVETIAPVDDFGAWVDGATVVETQLCIARTVDALTDEYEQPLIDASTTQPALSAPVQQRIAVRRSTIEPLDALATYPATPAVVRSGLRPVVDAHEAAETGQYDTSGSVDAETAEKLAATAAEARAASPALAPDADRCWFERRSGRDAVASLVAATSPIVAARCLALAQFDHAALVLADDPDAVGLAIAAQRALTRWFDPVPEPLVELDRVVVAAEFAEDPVAEVLAARDDLDRPGLGLDACDTAFAMVPRLDPGGPTTTDSSGG